MRQMPRNTRSHRDHDMQEINLVVRKHEQITDTRVSHITIIMNVRMVYVCRTFLTLEP